MSAYSRLGACLFVPQPLPSLFYLRSYGASGPFLVGLRGFHQRGNFCDVEGNPEVNAGHLAAPLLAEDNREVVAGYSDAHGEWRGAYPYLEQDRPEPMERAAPRYLSEAELWSLHDDALWQR